MLKLNFELGLIRFSNFKSCNLIILFYYKNFTKKILNFHILLLNKKKLIF